MAYSYVNPNPTNQRVGDCVIRAISQALNVCWETAYIGLTAEGLALYDMPSSNYVWGMYLLKHGFVQKIIEHTCPNCISVSEFVEAHPEGTYVLATQNHVVTAIDGNYLDSWDSGDEIVLYYFEKEEK